MGIREKPSAKKRASASGPSEARQFALAVACVRRGQLGIALRLLRPLARKKGPYQARARTLLATVRVRMRGMRKSKRRLAVKKARRMSAPRKSARHVKKGRGGRAPSFRGDADVIDADDDYFEARTARRRVAQPTAERVDESLQDGGRDLKKRQAAKPRPRVVNLGFTNPQGRAITANQPLLAKRRYLLRINVGPLSRQTVVENPRTVRADLLPLSPEGHWLKLAAVSGQFKVAEIGRWLFLPTVGPSWCCSCAPQGPHTCTPVTRKPQMLVPVDTPPIAGRAELRVTLYFQTSVVQSLLVTADIVSTIRRHGANRAVVDYNLTNRLTDLTGFAPRALSVMMNDSDDGTHRLVFNGAPDNPVTLNLTDGQMTAALKVMRTVMRGIHIEQIGRATPTNLYDSKNAKSRKNFIADLRNAATEGWRLWSSIWQDRLDEWTENEAKFLGESDTIQIARKQNSTNVFPWAMVYSIPIDTGAPERNRLCRLLDEGEWKKFQDASDFPTRCPFESEHGEDVICPYGFWGFRYQIEQPPSQPPGRGRVVSIPADPKPLTFVAALSEDLDQALLTSHLNLLTTQHKGFLIQKCRTRDEIKDGLGTPELELVYFYCHGLTNQLPGEAGVVPSLGVGSKEVINPPDLIKWALKAWPKDHWKTIAPLVFINGCHTADTTPQSLVNFVDTFSASLKAAGVIGTEITLHQLVANDVGQTFLDAFQRGNTVGRSLHQARAQLLRKGNLLGLVYTAYCSADLKFSASVV